MKTVQKSFVQTLHDHFQDRSPLARFKVYRLASAILEMKDVAFLLDEDDVHELNKVIKEWDEWFEREIVQLGRL